MPLQHSDETPLPGFLGQNSVRRVKCAVCRISHCRRRCCCCCCRPCNCNCYHHFCWRRKHRVPGITRRSRNAYRSVTALAVVGNAIAIPIWHCYQLDNLGGGDEQILATERGVIPCCTQKKRRSDAAGPALCYLVVNRRSPSAVLHHLLVSGCIIPRPPARWDPSLITTPSSCSIPSPSSHSRCRPLPHLDLSVSSGASLRHRRLRLRAWAVRRNFRACVLSRQARRSCCLDACG